MEKQDSTTIPTDLTMNKRQRWRSKGWSENMAGINNKILPWRWDKARKVPQVKVGMSENKRSLKSAHSLVIFMILLIAFGQYTELKL